MKVCFLVLPFLCGKRPHRQAHTAYTQSCTLIQEMQKITEQFKKNHKQTEFAILKFQSSVNGSKSEKKLRLKSNTVISQRYSDA